MDLTTLERLLATGRAREIADGLTVVVDPAWIVPGETRLSYTTMVRLAECVRERHWQADVVGAAHADLDSTLKSCSAEFTAPVDSGATIDLVYRVTRAERHRYELTIEVRDHHHRTRHAVITMVCVVFEKAHGVSRGARSTPCLEAVALLGAARGARARVA